VIDVRWFASNAYTSLVVPELRRLGLTVDQESKGPARLALAMSGTVAECAWHYARAWRCPLVVYIWDLPPKATGVGSYDQVWSIGGHLLRIPKLRGGYGRRRGYYSRLRYIAAHAQQVWVPSTFSRDLVRSGYGLESRLVPYCYDSARFRPGDVPRAEPPVLLTVSRLRAHKNQASTIRAASRLRIPVQVRLIGRGSEHASLERLARTLDVHCRIETEASDDDVRDAYREARVVVCPSSFEGFGLTPIEAVASGTPVVASDIPPHREFVGSAVRFYPSGDEDALAESISRAMNDVPADPGLVGALSIGAAARRFMSHLRPLLQ
jgi:glycosyltransferase involved in cell wall biosynthesis